MKWPPVSGPALSNPDDWNCSYSRGGRVEMRRKVFKDSMCSHLPECSVKMKHQCQPLKIICLLMTSAKCPFFIPNFMYTSPYSHEHNNIHFCQRDRNGKCCRTGDFIWYRDDTESDSQSNMQFHQFYVLNNIKESLYCSRPYGGFESILLFNSKTMFFPFT